MGMAKLHWEKPEDPNAELASVGRNKLFLANFLVTSSPAIRQAAVDHFCKGQLASYSSCNTTNDRQVFNYFRRVRDHMFNVAPEGMGLDCYRQTRTDDGGACMHAWHMPVAILPPPKDTPATPAAGCGKRCTWVGTPSYSTRE